MGLRMATLEIPDDVLAALRADARARNLTDDPAGLVVGVVRRHLAEVCAPGFDHDPLTGLGTRQGLRARINRATFGSSWTDRSTYRERFLCIDLDYFKKYLDVHGLSAGDVVLRRLAKLLADHFGQNDVYRFGGDEFVVVLGDRAPWVPEAPTDVNVTHTVVEVALHRSRHRNHHVNKWIEMHLDAGVLASKSEGARIECGDPIWLAEVAPR
jgi:diguanylate cyclase (GGDEF)-like protein